MNKVIFLLPVVMLSACATGYHPSGFSGGFSEQALSSTDYIVSYNSNGFTGKWGNQKHLLHRCAELTRNHGYKYFNVLADRDSSSTYVIPGSSTTTANANYYGSGTTSFNGNSAYSSYSGSGYGAATTTYRPPMVGTKPGQIMKIRFTNKQDKGAINAGMILAEYTTPKKTTK